MRSASTPGVCVCVCVCACVRVCVQSLYFHILQKDIGYVQSIQVYIAYARVMMMKYIYIVIETVCLTPTTSGCVCQGVDCHPVTDRAKIPANTPPSWYMSTGHIHSNS